ncbi:MAG: hypothetical protein CL945_00330 [Dinoroseobacter sp.]|nr:hypothetical protein [Dinoroseobacter sp.]
MRRLLSALLLPFLAALPVSAQDRDQAATILVLDASGSMWGQIDGVNKIVIAREVIGDLLTRIPADMALGLTMYGHNRRGDCSDIETMVQPGIGNRDQIAQIVNEVNPRGRTPLSDAVIQAAEQLRYTENPATVILVSDGRETCNADPCAVGLALEEAGIDFTAHVIGFDVSEQEDRAQLQCLAENTGGQFLTASNAAELADALEQVVVAPAPPPPATITMQAVVAPDNTAPVSPLMWEVFTTAGQQIIEAVQAPAISAPLPAGDYRIQLYRMAQETTHEGVFTVVAGQDQVVTLVLPEIVPEATVSAPDTAPIGTTIPVDWTGPDAANDAIVIARPDGQPTAARIATSQGNPTQITLPTDPGDYLVQYYHAGLRQVLAEQPITVTPIPATLEAPQTAVAGSTIEVGWTGPDAQSDFIAAGPVGEATYATYSLTRDGNPAQLRVPSLPGSYELRYTLGTGREVLATHPLTVTPATATLDAPETALAGETIDIAWTGPGYAPDFIAVGLPGETSYTAYALTREGSPARLAMPVDPGSYELRYVMQQDRVVIATRPIEISDIEAVLDAPDSAVAGSDIQVSWTGPDYRNDFIAVSGSDDPSGYENYTYTREGTPLSLTMPTEPGTYEIRYYVNQDRTIIGRRLIEVTELGATLDAPATAEAGSTVQVAWSGPDYRNDFVAVSATDDPTGYENYTYTRDGSPAAVQMPTEPGEYELRYYVNQDRTIIARQPIQVTAVGATLDAPATAEAGSTVQVAWTGPDYRNDFVAVSATDDPTGYENYTYTRDGTPAAVEMPTEPGTYELRYYVNQDRTIITRREIVVTEVFASLDAPATASVDETIQVGWQGPAYQNDFVAIGEPGDDSRYQDYAYARNGSPSSIQMPSEPGTYELRYYLGQDRRILTRVAITVTAE